MSDKRVFPPHQLSAVERVLPQAFDSVFDSLGETPKRAVLQQLKHRYALTLDAPGLSVEKLAVAILDIFGTDGGKMLVEQIWLSIEEFIAAESEQEKRHPSGF